MALLYSASGAIGGIRHAVNDAWGWRETRPLVPAKGLDVGLTLVAGPVLIGAAGLALSGELESSIGDRPWLAAVAQFSVTGLLPFALVFAMLLLFFRVLPESPGATFGRAWPGALAAVAGILFVQLGADALFRLFGNANAIYGTMGALLAVVFAAYLIALAVITGAHVSAAAGRPDEAGDDGEPPGSALLRALRGLFVRPSRD